MHKVIVKVNSTQTSNTINTITTKNVANHHQKNGTSYIIYKEKMLSDQPAVNTMLKLTDNSLTLTRSGSVKLQQYFAEGATSQCDYETPFGKINMRIKTRVFTILPVTSDTIYRTIKIEYAVYLNGKWQSDNKLVIDIKPAN